MPFDKTIPSNGLNLCVSSYLIRYQKERSESGKFSFSEIRNRILTLNIYKEQEMKS